jgi:hypothetical protein
MKVMVHGPLAGYGPDGTIHSWAPDTVVEIDDNNEKAVTWGHGVVSSCTDGTFELVEDVAPKKTAKKEVPDGSAKRERSDSAGSGRSH